MWHVYFQFLNLYAMKRSKTIRGPLKIDLLSVLFRQSSNAGEGMYLMQVVADHMNFPLQIQRNSGSFLNNENHQDQRQQQQSF